MSDHHSECDKQWYTVLGYRVDADGCPTCQALRSDNQVYERELLEVMYAGEGWWCEDRYRRWTPQEMGRRIRALRTDAQGVVLDE